MTRTQNSAALEAEQSESGAFVFSGDPEKVYHGTPCKGCGGTLRRKSNRTCVSCDREQSRQRQREKYASDPEWAEQERERHRDPEYRERKSERRRGRVDAGLCGECGQPRLSEWLCWDCLSKKQDANLNRKVKDLGLTV